MIQPLSILFIYLFIIRKPTPDNAGSARVNAKERYKKERRGRRAKEWKGIAAQMGELPTPTRSIDALIGDEQQNKKKKTEE